MSTENDIWITMSERKPKASDYPIWVCDPSRPLDGERNNAGIYLRTYGQDIYSGIKFWRTCALPAPPPKVRSQAEEDEDRFMAWLAKNERASSTEAAWYNALAYRDAQNREDVEGLIHFTGASRDSRFEPHNDRLDRLRKRCGLQ